MANIKQTLTYLFKEGIDTDDLPKILKKFEKCGINYESISIGFHFYVDDSNIKLSTNEKIRYVNKLLKVFAAHTDSLEGTIYLRNLDVIIAMIFNTDGSIYPYAIDLDEIDDVAVECKKCHKLFFQLDTPDRFFLKKNPSKCLYCRHLTSIPILFNERINMKHCYFIDCQTADERFNCRAFKGKNMTQYLRMESNMIQLENYECIEKQSYRLFNRGQYFSCYFKNPVINWDDIVSNATSDNIKNIIKQMIFAVNICHINSIAHLNISKSSFKNNIDSLILSNFIYSERNLILYDDKDLADFYQSRADVDANEYFALLPEFKNKSFPIDPIKSDIFMLGKTIFDIIETFNQKILSDNDNIVVNDMKNLANTMVHDDPNLRPSLETILNKFELSDIKKYKPGMQGPFFISDPPFVKKLITEIIETISVDKGFKWLPKSYHLALNIILYLINEDLELIQFKNKKIIINHEIKKYIIGASLFAYLYHYDINENNLYENFYELDRKFMFDLITDVDGMILFDTHYNHNDESLTTIDFINHMVSLYSR